MQANPSSKQSDSGRSPYRLLLSAGLPLVLLLVFLGKQIINFDSIGWSNGFNHPLMGWDHLVTMLAVGVWAAQLRGQAIWMLPLAFVGVMSLGGFAGAAGLAIPSLEGIILLSVPVFGVLITRKVRFSAQVNVLIVAFFAFFHGFAHGQEISASASLISYTLGFMLATLLLHGAGILVAKLVVFAIASLLTVIFSNAALAKNAEAIFDIEDKNTIVTQSAGFGKKAAFGIAIDQPRLGGDYLAIPARKLGADEFSRQDIGDGGGSTSAGEIEGSRRVDSVEASAKSYSKDIKTVGNSDNLIFKQAALQALDKWPFDTDYISDHRLAFKHYYPDINQTPGRRLLSNGVGLTSPPASDSPVLAPQVSHYLRKTSISSIEEPTLQLISAKFDIGKSDTRTIKPCSQNYAASTLQGTATPWPTTFISYLKPIHHPSRLAVGAISRLHLPSVSPKNLPLVMLATWPAQAFITPT
ncbi:MAG: HupE/UreJ family protein [Methylococcaceae bacterium]|nr:HupE/UreJ family protein [Methylococcaceae bacterium]